MPTTWASAAAHRVRAAGLVLFAVVLVAGLVLVAARGTAAWHAIAESADDGQLQLRSDTFPAEWRDVRAGEVITWQLEASLHDAERSTLDLELDAMGSLVDAGLRASVEACTVEYATSTCAGTAHPIITDLALAELPSDADGRTWALAELSADAPRFVLVTVTVPESIGVGGLEGRLRLGFHAAGNEEHGEAPTGPDALAPTGADGLALVMLAIGGLGLGITLMARQKATKSAGADS